MTSNSSITAWITTFVVALSFCTVPLESQADAAKPVRVVVWDERQHEQKQAYANFLGNQIAEYLRNCGPETARSFEVKSVGLDEPDQGLPNEILDNCDVLIWWGHVRHGDVKDDLVKRIVERIRNGRISFIALHSAHWSKPFTEAMKVRAIDDAVASLAPAERATAVIKTIPGDRRLMRRDERLTPYFSRSMGEKGIPVLEIKLPSCVFPYVAAEGKPSHVRILLRNHPIVTGVPLKFDIPQTECYGGPFHVPKPDAQILEETWDNGETFPSGSVWKVGKGHVFYFRPGHETYPIFKQPSPLRIIENAARWLAGMNRR